MRPSHFRFPRHGARLLVVAGALLASTALATPSTAAPVVVQVITGGLLTANIADLTLSAVDYSHSQQSNTGTMTLTVDDLRGVGLGWNVTVQSSAFAYTGGNGGTDIPAANFALTEADAPTLVSGLAVNITGGPKVPTTSPVGSLDSARKVVQASLGFGLGRYTQDLDVSLSVPADSRAGTYTGTLTVTVVTGP